MRADTDPGVFLSEVFQLRDELSALGEVASIERLTTIILDALPTEKCSTIKIQVIRGPDIGLEEVNMIKTIIINHSSRSSVPKRSQELNRKGHDSGREPIMNGRESAMANVITFHYCKKLGYKKERLQ